MPTDQVIPRSRAIILTAGMSRPISEKPADRHCVLACRHNSIASRLPGESSDADVTHAQEGQGAGSFFFW